MCSCPCADMAYVRFPNITALPRPNAAQRFMSLASFALPATSSRLSPHSCRYTKLTSLTSMSGDPSEESAYGASAMSNRLK